MHKSGSWAGTGSGVVRFSLGEGGGGGNRAPEKCMDMRQRKLGSHTPPRHRRMVITTLFNVMLAALQRRPVLYHTRWLLCMGGGGREKGSIHTDHYFHWDQLRQKNSFVNVCQLQQSSPPPPPRPSSSPARPPPRPRPASPPALDPPPPFPSPLPPPTSPSPLPPSLPIFTPNKSPPPLPTPCPSSRWPLEHPPSGGPPLSIVGFGESRQLSPLFFAGGGPSQGLYRRPPPHPPHLKAGCPSIGGGGGAESG